MKVLKMTVLAMVVAVSGMNIYNSQVESKNVDHLTLENVEALAIPEWGDGGTYFCIGSGKVDCYDGTKVERQDSFMSLGDEYETE